MTVIYPTESIELISDELGIPTHVQETAHQIADDIQHTNSVVWGRAPSSVAAACIYVAGHLKDQRLSQADVADAAGCSEATIRSIYPTVVEHARGMKAIEGQVTDGTLRINKDTKEPRYRCGECGTVCKHAPGIGHYCPEGTCEVGDGPGLIEIESEDGEGK